MSDLLVFISSIMDRQKDDLSRERDAAREAILGLGLAQPWRFEDSPASSQRVDYSYLNKVAECDIFVLLLGREMTHPVRMEYDAAVSRGKPLLVFLKETRRSPELETFVKQLQVKWKPFADADRLKAEIRSALAQELIESHRQNRLPLSGADVAALERQLPPAMTVGQQGSGLNIAGAASVQARNVAGGDIRETNIRRAGGNYYEAHDHGVINIGSAEASGEIAVVLRGLKDAIDELDLPAAARRRAQHAIEGAAIETEQPDADKSAVAARLKEAAEIVKGVTSVALEATTFGKLLQQGLVWAGKSLGWLGL